MLVLSRQVDESIMMGEDVVIDRRKLTKAIAALMSGDVLLLDLLRAEPESKVKGLNPSELIAALQKVKGRDNKRKVVTVEGRAVTGVAEVGGAVQLILQPR